MSRPSDQELETALKKAADLREHSEDIFFLGKSLLNHNYRIRHLEHVLQAAKAYLHSGMSASIELIELQKSIDAADKANEFLATESTRDDHNVIL